MVSTLLLPLSFLWIPKDEDKLMGGAGAIWGIRLVCNTFKPSNVCTNCHPRSILPRLQVPGLDTMTSKQPTSSTPCKSIRGFSLPGIGGLCNSSRPPSAKSVATLDISRTGTGRDGSTSQLRRIRYTMVQRRRFQATVDTFRTATVLITLFQFRSQILAGYTPPLVPAAATFTKGRS